MIGIFPGTRLRAHLRACRAVGMAAALITPETNLASFTAVILPGGRSPLLWRLYRHYGWLDWLRATPIPMLGTCAGLVILARLGILEVSVQRGGFPLRQFSTPILIEERSVIAEFSRAPRLLAVGCGVDILAALPAGEPVAVRQGSIIATCFHPESGDDLTFHRLVLCRSWSA